MEERWHDDSMIPPRESHLSTMGRRARNDLATDLVMLGIGDNFGKKKRVVSLCALLERRPDVSMDRLFRMLSRR